MQNTEHENAKCESCERLRAALSEAVGIAHGSGADFTWQAVERLRVLGRIAAGQSVDEQAGKLHAYEQSTRQEG